MRVPASLVEVGWAESRPAPVAQLAGRNMSDTGSEHLSPADQTMGWELGYNPQPPLTAQLFDLRLLPCLDSHLFTCGVRRVTSRGTRLDRGMRAVPEAGGSGHVRGWIHAESGRVFSVD